MSYHRLIVPTSVRLALGAAVVVASGCRRAAVAPPRDVPGVSPRDAALSRDAARPRDAAPPPTDVPAADAARVWIRTGAEPARAALRAALAVSFGQGNPVDVEGSVHALGDGRFVVTARSREYPGDTSEQTYHQVALVSQGPSGVQVESWATIPTIQLAPHPQCYDAGVVGVDVRDFDHDGELEVAVTLSYCGPMRPALGLVRYREVAVIDPDPTARVAASWLTRVSEDACTVETRALDFRWIDEDHDGHPDLRVTGEVCNEDPDGGRVDPNCVDPLNQDTAARHCHGFREVFRYSAATDGWNTQVTHERSTVVPSPRDAIEHGAL